MAALSTLAAIGLGLSAIGTGAQIKMGIDARNDAEEQQKKADAKNQQLLADKQNKDAADVATKRQLALNDSMRAKLADQRISMGRSGSTLLTSPLGVTSDYSGAGGKTALGS